MQERKPGWLKVKIPPGKEYNRIKGMLRRYRAHTICEEARCPNRGECFSNGTATFLILGDTCTRDCLYCNVKSGKPSKIDSKEIKNISQNIKKLDLKYAVITSVTRDDLPDGGAKQFSEIVKDIKENRDTKVELLIPDFKGDEEPLKAVVNSKPDILGHNIEVVERLFNKLRPQGNYGLSLSLLKKIKEINPKQKTKSGLMLGLGEDKEEIIKTMKDLRKSEVDFLTIGQYLQPRKGLAKVCKYYTPGKFKELKNIGMNLGFIHVESGPLVRSSYRADKLDKYC